MSQITIDSARIAPGVTGPGWLAWAYDGGAEAGPRQAVADFSAWSFVPARAGALRLAFYAQEQGGAPMWAAEAGQVTPGCSPIGPALVLGGGA